MSAVSALKEEPTMTTDPTTSKEAWLAHVIEQRNVVWNDYQDDEADLAHVILYLREDPKALPGKKLEPRGAFMFAGHFYVGPEAAMPIEDFQRAWSQMIVFTSVAGLGIATVVYQEIWRIDPEKVSEDEVLPDDYRDDPRAEEHLIFRAEHLDYGVNCWGAQITRPDGKRHLAPWEDIGNIGGPMFEFLARDKPTTRQRMAAREILQRLEAQKGEA
jgi:hypothetical protein